MKEDGVAWKDARAEHGRKFFERWTDTPVEPFDIP